jgi:hypothetical protein
MALAVKKMTQFVPNPSFYRSLCRDINVQRFLMTSRFPRHSFQYGTIAGLAKYKNTNSFVLSKT